MKRILYILALLISCGLQVAGNDSLKTKKFMFGVSASPQYCYRVLKTDDEHQFIKDLRDTLEVSRWGYTAGLNALYSFNKNISAEVGLLFADYGEKTKNYLLNNNPSSKGPIRNTFTYHYYYLYVPLKANYYILKKKLKAYITAGVSANVFLMQKTIAQLEYSYKDDEKIKSTGNSGFAPVNLSLVAGLGIQYKVSDKCSLKIEPLYTRSLTSITTTPVKEYLYAIGLNVGILLH